MWKNLATLSEVKDKQMLKVESEEKAILLTYYKGNVYAMNDKCPHMGTSLATGSFNDGVVTCRSHHTMIDITNGEIVGKAKILFLKMPVKDATTYPVKIEGDNVLVDL